MHKIFNIINFIILATGDFLINSDPNANHWLELLLIVNIFTFLPYSSAGPEEEETWMDASEFFRTGSHLLPEDAATSAAEAARCGRSSVIRIRQENRGRVFNSVVKFSGPAGAREAATAAAATAGTPIRRGGGPVAMTGTRRMSARMGVAANITPSVLNASATTR